MESNDWKKRLTPFDAEMLMMVASLTQKECEPVFDDGGYRFNADYENHQTEPNWITALWGAIEGRAGERLLDIENIPECHCLVVKIKFSEDEYPSITRLDRDSKENPAAGDLYCKSLDEVRAVQVTRANVGKLLALVGNGEMEIERCPEGKATFHFRNAGFSVWNHAPEFSYIIYRKPGQFLVMDRAEFEKQYERK